MEPFTRLTAVAAPVERKNVNTDMILPARFMRKPRGPAFASYLFHDLRFRADGGEDPDFVLNRAPYRDARILACNTNFGCGSSRETAVYALHDYGVRALIAPSFGDIFAANCIKNGLLPIRLSEEIAADLRRLVSERPGVRLTIDLAAQSVAAPERGPIAFDVDPFDKERLLNGLDEVALTLRDEPAIAAFERRYRAELDWLSGPPA